MVRGSVRRADVRHSHARATHELPIQTSTPRKTTTMRSPILLLLLGVLLALTPGAEAGKLGKLLWWKHWGKHGHGHRSGSGWWASPATKSDAKGMDHGDMMKMHGDMDMSHMDDDADDDDSQDWWRSKSWRTESWWGKHMSRHGGWKMRSSGRAFGSGQGIRAAKCMVRECGMELQKCRMDMTCRQGVKCAVGEDSSSPVAFRVSLRVPLGLSTPATAQSPRLVLELSASPFVGNEEKLLTFWLCYCDPDERLRHGI